MTEQPIIVAKGVDVTYALGKSNEVKALKNASLEIYPGEFVIFFGPSGCGKSTLLYSIAGLDRNATGSIKIFGKDVVEMKEKELEYHYQKTIGMVFQAFYLIPSLSVLQNVMLPQIAINVPLAQRKKKALELLNYFGVGHHSHMLPTELSGGQQQRVAISRALVNDPEIILADEPVGNLDSKSAEDTLRMIQELNLKEKKTIILVTHDPAHLAIANRIFYMKDGEILDMKYNATPKVVGGGITITTKKQREIQLGEKEGGPKEGQGKSDLEMVAKLYGKQGVISGLLLDFKAKQIVTESLTGLSTEEVESIEERVKKLLLLGTQDHDELLAHLDKEEEKGGLGMDKRFALNLVKKIKDIVKEVRFVSEPPKRAASDINELVDQLRYYLLDAFDVKIAKTDSVEVLNRMIKERIYGFTDRKGVRAVLSASLVEGGAGMTVREARQIAKLLDLILLGKYSGRAVDENSPALENIKTKVRQVVDRSKNAKNKII